MSRRSLITMAALAAVTAVSTSANAQLASSPDAEAIALPDVDVSVDQPNAGQQPKRKVKAPAAAQQSSTPRATTTGSETASGTAQPDTSDVTVAPTGLTTSVEKVASSVSVVTSKEIEAQQRRTVPDVLRSLPGINVVQSGGAGALTSIFVRGTNSNHVKVLIDGIEVSDPSSANRVFDFGQLQAFDIDRVELLRGPQSGLYGADALGGVIAIYTKKGDGPAKVSALVEGGSFGTFNQAASARGSTGAFNYSFNVSHQRADDIPVTPFDYIPPGTQRFNNDWDNWTYSTKLGYDITKDIAVNVVARYTDSRLDFTGDGFDILSGQSIPNNFQSRTDTGQLFTRGETVVKSFGGALTSYFGINYIRTDTDSFTPDPFFSTANLNDGERIRYDWRSVLEVAPGYTLVAGADHQNEKLDTLSLDPFSTTPFTAEESNTGGYVQADAEPVRNLFLTGNLRHDDNENFGGATTYRLASAYVIEQTGTKLKGSYGTAFKAPSLSQRFQDFPAFFFFGNPNLRPEESKGFDVGFEQSAIDDRLRFGAVYFHNDISDLIQGTFDPVTFISSLDNIGNAKTEGVEAFASADVTDEIRLRADYTLTDATNEDTGQELLRRPRHKASLTAGWTPIQPLLLSATLLYVGESADVDRATFGRVTLPSFTVVNVAADYKLNDNMNLFGRIDNLFDENYENPDGFLGQGIGGFVGLRLTN